MLHSDQFWVWDSWYAQDGEETHVFFLKAPRSLGDPDLRHDRAVIGHAVSRDLTEWRVLDDALQPGTPGSWDDLTVWTGSTISADDRWWMFYTGRSITDPSVQRIGVAVSDDLLEWNRLPGPVVEADSRWYETKAGFPLDDETWRDPWVFRGGDGVYHMLITARGVDGPGERRGVVGHATSMDLIDWTVHPPLSTPSHFGHLEVIQVFEDSGRWHLVFSCQTDHLARAFSSNAARMSITWVAPADGPLGPFSIDEAKPLLPNGHYAGRVIDHPRLGLTVLAFVDRPYAGRFVGALTDPRRWSNVAPEPGSGGC